MKKLVIILIILCAVTIASAEWVTIDNFGGVNTNLNSSQVPMGSARKCVHWIANDGLLERYKIDRLPVLGEKPTSIIGQHVPGNDRLLYVSDADTMYWFQLLDGTSGKVQDSAYNKGRWSYNDVTAEIIDTTIILDGEGNRAFAYMGGNVKDYSDMTNDYQYVITHRRRLFYASAENTYEKTIYGWTTIATYDDNAGQEALEGSDPITGLSSLGSLVLYRRHGIEVVSGYSIDDFYKSTIPCGVGAVTQHSIARWAKNNVDVMPNERGLWQFDGATMQQIQSQLFNMSIFKDSINWAQEAKICGKIWDDKYWLGVAFGASSTNDRLVVLDLVNGGVSFVGGIEPQSIWVFRGAASDEVLYIGDVSRTDGNDKGTIWQIDASDDSVYVVADYRDGWYIGEGIHNQKLAREYRLTYYAANTDSVFVDFYKDYSETVVWADTIVATATGEATFYGSIKRTVRGKALSFGIRTPDVTPQIISFALDIAPLGKMRKQ